MTTHPPPQLALIALSEAATPGPWVPIKRPPYTDESLDEQRLWTIRGKHAANIVSTLIYSTDYDAPFIAALVNWFRANYTTQSRPEAELPEVTDERVERAEAARQAFWETDSNYPETEEEFNADPSKYDKLAMRAALQAAYGQQCAATRPAEVDPSMEPFCVDDVRATAGKGDRSDD